MIVCSNVCSTYRLAMFHINLRHVSLCWCTLLQSNILVFI
jgi:hypothetical protein